MRIGATSTRNRRVVYGPTFIIAMWEIREFPNNKITFTFAAVGGKQGLPFQFVQNRFRLTPLALRLGLNKYPFSV